jgi:acyl dehydratase
MRPPATGDTIDVPLRFGQADFDEFARLSGDDNPIHVDPEFCRRTRFGRPVAHGMMLFGMLDAAVNRWLELPLAVWSQELTFRAPTYADDDLVATLRVETSSDRSTRIGQWIHRSDGAETAGGSTVVGAADTPATADGTPEAPPFDPKGFRGIRPGMTAASTRTITADDVAAYRDLVDDPNPRYAADGAVPPAILGGLVSHLLGVHLPGRGTNWLRQRFAFHAPVAVGTPIATGVEVTRVRPDKALVDLATTCTAAGRTAVTGAALVLIAELEQ